MRGLKAVGATEGLIRDMTSRAVRRRGQVTRVRLPSAEFLSRNPSFWGPTWGPIGHGIEPGRS